MRPGKRRGRRTLWLQALYHALSVIDQRGSGRRVILARSISYSRSHFDSAQNADYSPRFLSTRQTQLCGISEVRGLAGRSGGHRKNLM